ncbi:MAG TPA: hypothetical protein VLZ03_05950 [Thermodesulfobacteriota bacterium]|nr:hypothetical protein [Thermodesulfobacteriota bacterium]
MPIETTRDQERNLTVHVVTGPVSEQEMYGTLEEFYKREPTALLLWDLSKADLSWVTPNMLQRFVRKAVKLGARRRGGRTAVVAPEDLQYGLGRMTEAFVESESAPFSFHVFRSRQDALSWLMADDAS